MPTIGFAMELIVDDLGPDSANTQQGIRIKTVKAVYPRATTADVMCGKTHHMIRFRLNGQHAGLPFSVTAKKMTRIKIRWDHPDKVLFPFPEKRKTIVFPHAGGESRVYFRAYEPISGNDYIMEARPKYESSILFNETNSVSQENIIFENNINDTLSFYTDSVKTIYQGRPIYVRAYSVLAYNGADKEEAVLIRSQILRYFPEVDVKLDYDTPNFKLKVGPFSEKLDAVRIKEGLLKRDVKRSVLIVPDKILIKKK